MKLLGIDDAGRGPVIGPMILTGVLINPEEEQAIKNFGAKDSKLLTPFRRRQIRQQVESQFDHKTEISTPQEIDDSSNLNYLEAIKAAKIINYFSKKTKDNIKAIIDCPSVNIQSWSNDVQQLLENPEQIILQCEHKADYNHPIVAAASIIAKETREESLRKLKESLQIDFGSGYPADPKTKKFLEQNFDNEKYTPIIRFSWNTIKKLFKAKTAKQKKLF